MKTKQKKNTPPYKLLLYKIVHIKCKETDHENYTWYCKTFEYYFF